MVLKSDFRGKFIIDRLMIILYLTHCVINVFSHLIIQTVGGIGNIAFIYFLLFYFAFIYGKPNDSKKYVFRYVSLGLFLFIYIYFMQFLYHQAQFYDAHGVNFETHVWNLISFIPLILTATFIALKTNRATAIWIRRVFICLLLMTLLPSVVFLIKDPSLAKLTATSDGGYVPFLVNYSVIYGLAIIIPYFFFSQKLHHKFLVFAEFTVGLLAIVGIYMSSFFIALMATVGGLLIGLILRIRNKRLRFLIIFFSVSFVVVFLYTDAAYHTLNWISANIIQSQLLSTRFEQVALFLKTGETGDSTVRIDLYKEAVDLVIRHPLTGNILWNDAALSGHSVLLDVWGGCGIIAVATLISFFASIYKSDRVYCRPVRLAAAFNASTISLLFVSLVNPVFASPSICIFWILAPLMFGIKKEDLCI